MSTQLEQERLDEALRPEMIADPRTYGDEPKLRRLHAWLQSEHPVARAAPEGYRPFWIVSKYNDIREIELKSEIFLAAPRNVLLTEEMEQANLRNLGTINGATALPQLDGVKHRKLRLVTQAWFMPKNIAQMRDRIEVLAAHHVDKLMNTGGECDFANDIAFWYPLRVATTILGLPPEDEPHLMRLTQELFAFQDPEFMRGAGSDAVVRVMADYVNYFEKVTADRRANPRDDVSTVIANAVVDGEPLEPLDLVSYYIIVATAGHDTTSASIAGGLLALIDHPEEWARLRANPDLSKPLADEAIRYTAPVKHFMRTATEDYELRGETIKAGDNLYLAYDAACRDPDIFEDPQRFIIDRSPNAHLAFGYGPHICLGQHVAKMEIELFFRELVRRVQSVELAGQVEYAQSSFVSGVKRMPIRFRAA